MTISGIGARARSTAPTASTRRPGRPRCKQILGPVAQLFGESTQQLTNDLQSGKTSLTQLAESKGISQTDLLSAIQQGLQQSSANGGAPSRAHS